MQTLFQDVYKTVSYDASKSYLLVRWHENTVLMDEAGYKEIMLTYREIIEKFHPDYVIIDTRKFYFTIAPEVQEWTNQHINAYLEEKVPVRKAGFICSAEFFAQLSLEQTINDTQEEQRNKIAFFEDEDKALDWLFQS